jgi:uncharacterized membrane protein
MFLKALTVAGLATFEIYAAIPAGLAFGLSPWTIFFASVVGGLTGVFVAAFLGNKIRALVSCLAVLKFFEILDCVIVT